MHWRFSPSRAVPRRAGAGKDCPRKRCREKRGAARDPRAAAPFQTRFLRARWGFPCLSSSETSVPAMRHRANPPDARPNQLRRRLEALLLDRMKQPRFCVGPMPLDGPLCDADMRCNFTAGHSSEKLQHHHPGLFGALGLQPLDGFVDQQDLFVCGGLSEIQTMNVNAFLAAAALDACFASRRFHKDAPHGLCGGGEELSPVRSWLALGTRQANPGFVD